MLYSRQIIGLVTGALLALGGAAAAAEDGAEAKDRFRISYGPGQLEQAATASSSGRLDGRAQGRAVSLRELAEDYEWRRRSLDRMYGAFRDGAGAPPKPPR